MSSSLLAPLLWSFLPGYLTRLSIPYFSAYLPALFPSAPPGSQRFRQNYRLIFSFFVGCYLIWSFLQVRDTKIEDDWYGLLRLDRGAGDEALRKAFRSL